MFLRNYTNALRLLVAHLDGRDLVTPCDTDGDLLPCGLDFLRCLDRISRVFRARDRDGLGDKALGAAQFGIASILLVGLAQEPFRQCFERDRLFGLLASFARGAFGFAALFAFIDPRLKAVSFGLDDFRWRIILYGQSLYGGSEKCCLLERAAAIDPDRRPTIGLGYPQYFRKGVYVAGLEPVWFEPGNGPFVVRGPIQRIADAQEFAGKVVGEGRCFSFALRLCRLGFRFVRLRRCRAASSRRARSVLFLSHFRRLPQ